MRVTGLGGALFGIQNESPHQGVVLRRHYEGSEDWLEIISAMPRAMFSAELLHMIRSGRGSLDVSLDKLEIGGLLRIRDHDDRVLVYRLVEHQFELDVWFGEWPD
jgi:hypothetical protein